MAITAVSQVRQGNVITMTAVSDISPVEFHWYIDGAYYDSSRHGVHTFYLKTGDQGRIEVFDTNPGVDPFLYTPTQKPARRSLCWIRSLGTAVAHYRVEQKKGAGSYSTVATVAHEEDRWSYSCLTERLDDLSEYTWRITPVDQAGNDGTAITVGPEMIVRTPNAPDFTVSFDGGTSRVTFTEAA